MRGVVYQVTGSRDATNDVLQDSYVKAFRAVAKFRGESSFGTWLYRITRNTAVDHVRSMSRHRRHTTHEFDEAALRATGAIDVSRQVELRQSLAWALSQLSEDQLAIVTLVEGEGYSYDQVAQILDVSPGTVASRLSRARAALRQLLGADESEYGTREVRS